MDGGRCRVGTGSRVRALGSHQRATSALEHAPVCSALCRSALPCPTSGFYAFNVFPSKGPPDAQCSSAPLEEPPLRPHCVCSPMLPSRRPAAVSHVRPQSVPIYQHCQRHSTSSDQLRALVLFPSHLSFRASARPKDTSAHSPQSCMPSAVSTKREWHVLRSATSGKAPG
jgi:hypothetical protein